MKLEPRVTEGNGKVAETFFAPGRRDSLRVILDESEGFAAASIGQQVLDAIPDLAMVLNDKRQIVAANKRVLESLGIGSVTELYGKRPGEAIMCIHAGEGPHGCGTSRACSQCGAAKAIIQCLNSQAPTEIECRISTLSTEGEHSHEFLASANFVRIGAHPLVLMVLRDVSAENRKRALERLFFHDVLNTVGGIAGLADLMVTERPKESPEYASIIHRLAESVSREINSFRNLLEAENGNLRLEVDVVCVSDVFDEVIASVLANPSCRGRRIVAEAEPGCCFRSDPRLVNRVVGNLAKNALEASPTGALIRLSASRSGDCVRITVHNPGVIAPNVQSQLFKRSFSTKGEPGRGLGTYSIRLFAERYLKGKVEFFSSEEDGTTFAVTLPSLCAGDC